MGADSFTTSLPLWGDLLASLSGKLSCSSGSCVRESGRSLLLLLLANMIHVQGVGLVDLAHEEMVIGEELFLVNGLLVQKHTSNDSGDLVSVDSLDCWVNAITDEVLPLISLDIVEVREVNLWQLKELLLLLLLLHVLDLLLRHLILVATVLAALRVLWSSLGTTLFVIAILLLIALIALILVWILRLILLAFALAVATSALSSTAASVSTSTSVVMFVSLGTFAHHLGWGTLIPLH